MIPRPGTTAEQLNWRSTPAITDAQRLDWLWSHEAELKPFIRRDPSSPLDWQDMMGVFVPDTDEDGEGTGWYYQGESIRDAIDNAMRGLEPKAPGE